MRSGSDRWSGIDRREVQFHVLGFFQDKGMSALGTFPLPAKETAVTKFELTAALGTGDLEAGHGSIA
jgi:hypothetical protein